MTQPTKYDPPYTVEEIRKNYPQIADKLLLDPIHKWRAEKGIELIHKEPTVTELDRIWSNWQLMTDKQKKLSNKKSIELFGIDNESHYKQLKNQRLKI